MKYDNLYMKPSRRKIYEAMACKEYDRKKNLGVKVIDDATILPAKQDFGVNQKMWAIGGVLDKNRRFVEESSSSYLFGGYYEYNEAYVDYVDEEVIFFGPFVEHWGHFICDQISRLWYVVDNPSRYKIAYCGWKWNQGNSDLSGSFLELFELLGIKREKLINVQKPTKFKKVIIPDFSFMHDKFYSEEFEKLTSAIVGNVKLNLKKCPSNIYFTRSLLGNINNKESGEDKIIEYFSKRGYEILAPERLSLSEQIFYLNNAKNISMISGSISHNVMFCKNNTNVIILNKTSMLNNYQMTIDKMTKANISYIDIYKKMLPVLFGLGPFLICVTKYLKSWGGKEKHANISLRQYIWYFKCYFKTYKNQGNRELLKSQSIGNKRMIKQLKNGTKS